MNHIDYNGSGELYICDIDDAREEDKSGIDRVITVCQENVSDNISEEKVYNFFCMSDGPNNGYDGDDSYEMFEEAADTLHDALANDESVLLHCHVGKSRSVSVATAALGRLLDLPRHESYDIVRNYRPQAHPKISMMEKASLYITTYTETTSLWEQYEDE